MKKYFPLPVFIFCSLLADAQFENSFQHLYADSLTMVGIEGDYTIASTAITTAFASKYWSNSYIDSKTKDEVIDNLKNENLAGTDFNAGIYFKHRIKKLLSLSHPSYSIALKNRIHSYSEFPPDLFELYFYGNYRFAGETASVSNFDYRYFEYQQLQFGLENDFGKGDQILKACIAVSFLNGQYYLDIKTDNGGLYTQTDGEYIDLNLQLTSRQTDTTKKNFGSSNGLGVSGDFFVSYGKKKDFLITLSVKDAGFINWNNKSVTTTIDTNYHFEGVEVNNLLDSIYVDITNKDDFVNGFLKSTEEKSFNTTLPARFILKADKYFKEEKFKVSVTIEERLKEKFNTQILVNGGYFYKQKLYTGINLTAGGYTKNIFAGIDLGYRFKKDFLVTIGSRYLTGYLFPHESNGQGVYFSVVKVF